LISDLEEGVLTPQTQIGGFPDSEIRNQSQTKPRMQPCSDFFPIPDQRDTAAHDDVWKASGAFPQNLTRGSM
jgi:hypothetical protein